MKEIRKDFPELERIINGHKLVYLDNAATSLRPQQVIDAIVEFYSYYNANIHRGVHTLSREATSKYEEAHEKVAKFINASSMEEIIFTRNTTESINLIAYTFLLSGLLKEGDDIVISLMEHHSNMVPWQMLRDNFKINLHFIRVLPDGTIDMDHLKDILKKLKKFKLLSITHASNVLGTVNPVKEISNLVHRYGGIIVVDGAQSVPHLKVDVQDINCDFLAFSGHKMLGPTGIGVLYGKKELLEKLQPFLRGGDMIWRVEVDKVSFNKLPWKFEAGTSNIAGGIGLGAAVDYLQNVGMQKIEEHEKELTIYALKELKERLGGRIQIYGPENRIGVIAFNIIRPDGNVLSSDLVASYLDKHGIAIRSGCHCAQPLHNVVYNIRGTARASFYLYNTLEEVKYFVEALEKFVNAL